ncbi:PAS domain-containing sensor histidine kinase [Peristeroidobacter agariperforans]|uniref:PAS domain-containing sensor histidine kinase n=1 Tax=Peristeroidobacter agariperforans TaxID=268404 RepID=UPI00101C66DF|nr:PAS domain-containing sensor histidine kinase [Peristeroidobacter agariperforans]
MGKRIDEPLSPASGPAPAEGAALDDSARQFARLIDGIRDCAIYMIDRSGNVVSWNPGAQRIKGYTAEEIMGRNFSEFYTPEDRHEGVPKRALSTAERTGKFEGEGWRVRKDGTKFWASVLIDALRSPEGDLIGFAKITRDMTERRLMQEQLHQSQKMEAIGQLTGGVAHDFNNLLTVILGNLDSLSQELPSEQVLWRRRVDHSLRAAERAAGLTQQLLAFARRQPLRPKAVEINVLLARWTEMVRRTLPENINVRRIEDEFAGVAEVDANQLENALLNLIVNARDAMPGGGTLTIETATARLTEHDARLIPDLTPGNYVLICVTDTGTGMTQEVLERVFDPFFTTKPMGQGTGLGLSQVFGFVKQSGGHIKIYSRAGHGTTVKIYLPQIVAAQDQGAETTSGAATCARRETILVVEDNDAVRSFTTDTLRDFGFNVIEAVDASEALKILDRNRRVELLFTDIGLPGLNGRELAATVQRRYPKVRLLFTSGYAQMPSPTTSSSLMEIPLLSKPFTRAQLYERIVQVLEK